MSCKHGLQGRKRIMYAWSRDRLGLEGVVPNIQNVQDVKALSVKACYSLSWDNIDLTNRMLRVIRPVLT